MTPHEVAQEAAQEVIRSHNAFYGGSAPGMLYGNARCVFHGALSRYSGNRPHVEFDGGWRVWAEKHGESYIAEIQAAFPFEKKKRRGPVPGAPQRLTGATERTPPRLLPNQEPL